MKSAVLIWNFSSSAQLGCSFAGLLRAAARGRRESPQLCAQLESSHRQRRMFDCSYARSSRCKSAARNRNLRSLVCVTRRFSLRVRASAIENYPRACEYPISHRSDFEAGPMFNDLAKPDHASNSSTHSQPSGSCQGSCPTVVSLTRKMRVGV